MRQLLAAAVIAACSMVCALAGSYRAPVVEPARFAGEEIALSAIDRDKLATSLAGHVANTVEPDANVRQLTKARRLLGLALHMSPRNRAAVVTSFQFSRGHAPKKVAADYSAATLAELLQTQARSLLAKKTEADTSLAGYLLDAAVEIDIANESAVYELEIYKKDVGRVDWDRLIGE